MALAIKFERLVREQRLRDYAEIARLGKVSRARRDCNGAVISSVLRFSHGPALRYQAIPGL
jgi:hypothetical protein